MAHFCPPHDTRQFDCDDCRRIASIRQAAADDASSWPTVLADVLEPYVELVLNALNHSEALVTDLSTPHERVYLATWWGDRCAAKETGPTPGASSSTKAGSSSLLEIGALTEPNTGLTSVFRQILSGLSKQMSHATSGLLRSQLSLRFLLGGREKAIRSREALRLIEVCCVSHRNDWLRFLIATDNA